MYEVDLASWRTLQSAVMRANEETLEDMLQEELEGRARARFLQRIYGRYKVLRDKRELEEILERAK